MLRRADIKLNNSLFSFNHFAKSCNFLTIFLFTSCRFSNSCIPYSFTPKEERLIKEYMDESKRLIKIKLSYDNQNKTSTNI